MTPYLLAGVEIPGLQFADMVGARCDVHRRGRPDIALSRRVCGRFTGDRAAQVFVGRDVEQPRLWAVGHRRPILAAPQRWAEIGFSPGAGLAGRVDIRPARLRIELDENVLLYKGLAVDKVYFVRGALQHPQIPVARGADETFDGLTVALVIDEDRRRHLVPIPGIIRVILVITLDLTGCGVKGEHRRGEQIVSGALVTHPRPAIPGAPKTDVCCGVVRASNPHRPAAGLPLIAGRPSFGTRLAGSRHRVGLPCRLASLGVKCRDKAADTEFAPRDADHDLTIGDE